MKRKYSLETIEKRIGILALAGAVLLLLTGTAAATTITVDDSGGADYTNIGDAVYAAYSEDTILVNDGTYPGCINVDKGISINSVHGNNDAIIRVDVKCTGDRPFGFYVRSNNVNITGFTLKGDPLFMSVGIVAVASNFSIVDNTVTGLENGILPSNNGTLSGNNISENINGIWIANVHNSTFSNNKVVNNSRGIMLYADSTDNKFIGNNISDNPLGMYLELGSVNNTLYHNNFKNVINVEIHPFSAYNLNYWDNGYPSGGNYWNDYTGADVDGDGIGDTAFPIPGAGVEDRYPLMKPYTGEPVSINSIHNINKTKDYPTIQSAIDDADAGNQINVDSGTYFENPHVQYKERLILEGIDTGSGIPKVVGQITGVATFTLEGGSTTIEGFNLSDSYVGIEIHSSGNVVKNNIMVNDSNGISLSYYGKNNISGNHISNNSGAGIYLYDSDDNNISDNEILNSGMGIGTRYSERNNFSNNKINNIKVYGIQLYDASNNNILIGNVVTNAWGGIHLFSSYNSLLNNNISSNGYGIIPQGSVGNNISVNNISKNGYGIYLDSAYGNSQNNISSNNFIENTIQAFDSNSENFWNASYPIGGNYWSDYSESDSYSGSNQDQPNADGIGDTPYEIQGGSNSDRYPLMKPYTGEPITPPHEIQVGEGAPTQEMKDAFKAAYDRNGGELSLGKPLRIVESDGLGHLVQEFPGVPGIHGGIIMNSSKLSSEAYYLHGAIWEKYKTLPDKSILGAVSQDEKEAGVSPKPYETTGNYSAFDNGRIHWIRSSKMNPKVGESFVTYGYLDAKYTVLGGTNHWLGFPTEDQKMFEGHQRQKFEGGWIYWNETVSEYQEVTKLIAIVPIEFNDIKHKNDVGALRSRADYLRYYYDLQSFEKERLGYVLYQNPNGNGGWYSSSEKLMDILSSKSLNPPTNIVVNCPDTPNDCRIRDRNELRLFNWNNIPGSGDEVARMKESLKSQTKNIVEGYDISWIDTANVEKLNNGNKISISSGTKFLHLWLVDGTKVVLTSDNSELHTEFITETVNGNLNVYDSQINETISRDYIWFNAISDAGLNTEIRVASNGDQIYNPQNYDIGMVVSADPGCRSDICRPAALPGQIFMYESYTGDPWAHEMGHIYGLSEEGYPSLVNNVGNWGVMAGDPPQNPAPPLTLYDKEKLSWINTPAQKIEYKTFNVRSVNDNSVIADEAPKFGTSDKYYIFEGRDPLHEIAPESGLNPDPGSMLKSDKGIELYLVENAGTRNEKISAEYACTQVQWTVCNDRNRVTMTNGEKIRINSNTAIVEASEVDNTLKIIVTKYNPFNELINDMGVKILSSEINSIAGFGSEQNLGADLHVITIDGRRIGQDDVTGEYYNEIEGGNSSGNFMGTGSEWISVPNHEKVRFYATITQDLKDLLRNDSAASVEITSILITYDETGNKTISAPINITVNSTNVDSDLTLPTPTPADTTSPNITFNLVDRMKILLNENMNFFYTVEDSESGVVSVESSVPNGTRLDTSSIGLKNVTVNATDNAGNTRNETITYRVVYNKVIIIPPINEDNSSIVKRGSVEPIKIRITNVSGNNVTNAVAKINITWINGTVSGTETEAVLTGTPSTDGYFRLSDEEIYIYHWGTKGLIPGTYKIRIELDDGTVKEVFVGLRK